MASELLAISCIIILYYLFVTILRFHKSDRFHFATFYILLITIFAANQNSDVIDDFEDWDWFEFAKRFGLAVGWIALMSVKFARNHQYAVWSWKFILGGTIFVMGLRALQEGELFGVVILILACFTPEMYEDDGFLVVNETSSFLQFQIGTEWFFRLYYISVGIWCFWGRYYNQRDEQIFWFMTTLIPFLLSEFNRSDNQVHIFMIHIFITIWSEILAVLLYPDLAYILNFYTIDVICKASVSGVATRNALEIVSFVLALILIDVIDRRRPSPYAHEEMMSNSSQQTSIIGPLLAVPEESHRHYRKDGEVASTAHTDKESFLQESLSSNSKVRVARQQSMQSHQSTNAGDLQISDFLDMEELEGVNEALVDSKPPPAPPSIRAIASDPSITDFLSFPDTPQPKLEESDTINDADTIDDTDVTDYTTPEKITFQTEKPSPTPQTSHQRAMSNMSNISVGARSMDYDSLSFD